MKKIKNKIKTMGIFKIPLMCLKYLKNKNFKIWVDSYGKNNALLFLRLGNKNKDKRFYYIKFDDPALGFFAYWKMSIIGLNYAESFGLIPVINWTNLSPYYEPSLFGANSNPLEYYFENVNDFSIEEVEKSEYVLMADINRDTVGAFSQKLSYDFGNQVENYSILTKKYFRVKEDLYKDLIVQIERMLCGKQTIGVHIRGVEWGAIIGHPIPPSLEDFFKEIYHVLEETKAEQVFVASDSEDTIAACRREFGSKMCTYDDVLRSKAGSKTLMLFDENVKRANNHYLMGFEVLRDMLTLSFCDSLIASFSNVGFAARVFKESRGDAYKELRIIQPKGICEVGISASDAVNKMKKGEFK